MSYSEKDFGNLLFNPLSKKEMLDTYPKLCEIVLQEWTKEPLLDNIIRYVIMVYDPKSILVMNEKDLNYRKGVAAELAEFDTNDEKTMEGVYSCANPIVLEMVVKYLMRYPKSKEWAAIAAFEFKYWESIRKIMQPIKDGTNKEELDAVQKKAAISHEIDEDIKRLDMYYQNFFGGDDELEKSVKAGRMTPESVAKLK